MGYLQSIVHIRTSSDHETHIYVYIQGLSATLYHVYVRCRCMTKINYFNAGKDKTVTTVIVLTIYQQVLTSVMYMLLTTA